jgi:anti-sigma factor RsiW
MADQPIASPPAAGTPDVGTDDCPHVADLINYALGRCLMDERRRVEGHLQKGECDACRSWVEKAAGFREAAPAEVGGRPFSATLRGVPPAPKPTSDPTPIPSSSQWQRRVFRDLAERLQRLEES